MPTLTELYGLEDQALAPPPKEDRGDTWRGVTETFKQLPQLGYGIVAGVGAAAENVLGEGGIATGVKKAGIKGYTEWGDKIAADSKESDSWTYSYNQAKEGNFGALVDWLQHGIGYAAGQGAQILLTAGIGAVGGKFVLGAAAKELAAGMVAKETARLAAENATLEATRRIAAEEIGKLAVKNVASKIGQTAAVGAMAVGQEGGEIFGDMTQQADKDGRQLTGADLGRAFGATLAAGGLEFVGDKLGLDVLMGRSKLLKPAEFIPGIKGRAARGIIAGAAVAPAEGLTEYAQTGVEEYGKGTEASPLPWQQSEANRTQAFDAAMLGGLSGGVMGGAGGAVRGAKKSEDKPGIAGIAAARTIDDAIVAAHEAVSAPTQNDRAAAIRSGLDGPSLDALRKQYGDVAPILASLATAGNANLNEAQREPHLKALEATIAALRETPTSIPAGIVSDAIPTGDATELGQIPVGEASELLPTGDTAPVPSRIPVGRATELSPETIEPAPSMPDAPPTRTRLIDPPLIDAESAPNAVRTYVDKQRTINTPMAHAFVKAFDAGKITPEDVLRVLMPRKQETADERLAAAAKAAPAEPTTLRERLDAMRRPAAVATQSGAVSVPEPSRSERVVSPVADDAGRGNAEPAAQTAPSVPGVVSAREGAADTEQALTPLERKQPWAKNVLRIGGRAFEDGKPRVAPEGFTRLESKGWLAGWDDAANSKPTADGDQALTMADRLKDPKNRVTFGDLKAADKAAANDNEEQPERWAVATWASAPAEQREKLLTDAGFAKTDAEAAIDKPWAELAPAERLRLRGAIQRAEAPKPSTAKAAPEVAPASKPYAQMTPAEQSAYDRENGITPGKRAEVAARLAEQVAPAPASPQPAKPSGAVAAPGLGAPKVPKSFRKTHMVTTPVFVEDTGRIETREISADEATKAIETDISELQAFIRCIKG